MGFKSSFYVLKVLEIEVHIDFLAFDVYIGLWTVNSGVEKWQKNQGLSRKANQAQGPFSKSIHTSLQGWLYVENLDGWISFIGLKGCVFGTSGSYFGVHCFQSRVSFRAGVFEQVAVTKTLVCPGRNIELETAFVSDTLSRPISFVATWCCARQEKWDWSRPKWLWPRTEKEMFW